MLLTHERMSYHEIYIDVNIKYAQEMPRAMRPAGRQGYARNAIYAYAHDTHIMLRLIFHAFDIQHTAPLNRSK
jgi:hypothetical protein